MKIEKKKQYTFKLVTGEEIVAKVEDVGDDHYVVSKPCTIMPNAQGQMQMVPSAYTMELDKNVQINISAVAMIFEPNESVQTAYTKATTGIDVPEKKIIHG
jgi:hypothetical protein